MKADEVPIGSGFLGSISRTDWLQNWRAGKPIDGEFVHVHLVKPNASKGCDYLREVMKLHAGHLPSDSPSQLSAKDALWVVGVRETRSKKVYIFDWDNRGASSYLEALHGMLNKDCGHIEASMLSQEAKRLLQNLGERKEPFL